MIKINNLIPSTRSNSNQNRFKDINFIRTGGDQVASNPTSDDRNFNLPSSRDNTQKHIQSSTKIPQTNKIPNTVIEKSKPPMGNFSLNKLMNNNDSTSKIYTKSQNGGSNQKLKNVNSNIASNRDYFNENQGFQNNTQ